MHNYCYNGYSVECYIVSKCLNNDHYYEFPSEDGEIGPICVK